MFMNYFVLLKETTQRNTSESAQAGFLRRYFPDAAIIYLYSQITGTLPEPELLLGPTGSLIVSTGWSPCYFPHGEWEHLVIFSFPGSFSQPCFFLLPQIAGSGFQAVGCSSFSIDWQNEVCLSSASAILSQARLGRKFWTAQGTSSHCLENNGASQPLMK